MSNTGYITSSVRNTVSKRDRGVCQHCQLRASRAGVSKRGILQYFDADGRVFHLDHVIPASKAGKATVKNMVLSCASCNMSKRRTVIANDPEAIKILKEFAP